MIPRSLIIGVAILLAATLGMSVYVWRIRGRVHPTDLSALNTQPVAPPVSGASEQVTLYVANDDAGVLRPQPVRIQLPSGRQERAAEILRALVTLYLWSLCTSTNLRRIAWEQAPKSAKSTSSTRDSPSST
jgi:hypothetical protein